MSKNNIDVGDFSKFAQRELELFRAHWENVIERGEDVLESMPFSDWTDLLYYFSSRGIVITDEEETDDPCLGFGIIGGSDESECQACARVRNALFGHE